MTSATISPVPAEFWAEYRALLGCLRVKPKAVQWYVKRARHFAWKRDLPALKAVTAEQVSAYFQRTVSRATIEEWQVVQMVDAVRVLCQKLLKLPWAAEFPWNQWEQAHLHVSEPCAGVAAAAPKVSVNSTFSDSLGASEALDRFPEHFERLRTELRTRHYSLRTEQAYTTWLARFVTFRQCQPPDALGATDAKAYLEYLATVREVSASTQNQALCALVFFYGQVLHHPLGDFGDFAKAKRPQRLPTVLSRDEVRRLFEQLEGTYALMVGLLYGAGLRLMECLRLRVKDLDFDHRQILVRDGKGQKDRVTVLPEKRRDALTAHLARVRALHAADLQAGLPGVFIWPALARPL